MKVIAINGSPRKQWNTAQLLTKVLEGASFCGAETRMVHLYDYNYKGCLSCFACKLLGSITVGRCAVRDGLTPLLEELHEADAVVIGSPLYLMTESGMTRAFLERYLFQYVAYTNPPSSHFPRRIRTAMVYTMNIPESSLSEFGGDVTTEIMPRFLSMTLGPCEKLLCTDTLQFDDYSRYENSRFDPEAKKKRHQEVFPQDEQCAFELGKRLTEPVTE